MGADGDMRAQSKNHMTSLRLPYQWHLLIEQFAEKWDTTPSYIYRRAIKEYMRQQKLGAEQ